MAMQRVVVRLALLLLLGSTTTVAVRNTYSTAGYNAGGDSYSYASCSIFGSYVSAYLYSQEDKFQLTGRNGYKSTNSFAGLSADINVAVCDDTTVTFTGGFTYSDTYFGDDVVFELDTNKLTSASLKDLQVPMYTYSCAYECMEICYPEIFGYGTCPEDELPYLECNPTTCDEEPQFVGVAKVDIVWTSVNPKGSPVQYKSSSVVRGKGYAYKYSSKGESRDANVSFNATLDGIDLLAGSGLSAGFGSIGSSSYMTIDRYRV